MRNLFRKLRHTLEEGNDAVLVTIVASSGSTPRGAGARMLVTEQGRLAGTIGGGEVEFHSQQVAQQLLKTGSSRLEHFQLRKNQIQDLGMVCGGDVHVYFRYVAAGDRDVIQLAAQAEELYQRGEPCWLITQISTDHPGPLSLYGAKSGLMGAPLPQSVVDSLGNRPVQVVSDDQTFFCEKLIQAGQVFIFGGGHVSQCLVPALAAIDFRCIILEDREEFCQPELFPGVAETRLISTDDPAAYGDITGDDYVCIMTRGHKDDIIVQSHVLKTPARYIGVIGSRRKTESVFARLREMGCTDDDLNRITTPIGLDIQAETPAEIAVSVAAQLIQLRARFNRDRCSSLPSNRAAVSPH